MKAESLIFRKLTPNEFKAITNTINSDGGGSQTYIDFPKGCISDAEFKEFFLSEGTPNTNGYVWNFKVNSLSLGRTQQNETISARRESSNSLREQNNENRIEIWKSDKSGFPTDSYDDRNNPIIVYILRSDDKEYWAGWFYRNDCRDTWPMTKGLSAMLWKDCAYIKFDAAIPFDQNDYRWPFGKMNSSGKDIDFSVSKQNNTFLTALRTKPFLLLAGISGTGKSQKVQELAFMTCPKNDETHNLRDPKSTTPGNYQLVEVKPNWHDSTELLGYYSALSGKYELTDFIRFTYKALQNPDVPFFLCLDEMNLAPVEQYFAEFLSVLETRKKTDEGIKTQPLLTKDKFSNCELMKKVLVKEDGDIMEDGKQYKMEFLYSEKDSEIIEYLKENGLHLPDNLFVIGTVNMDDTTHQFSRKVIDRAFTIEMNGGKMSEMFTPASKTLLEYREEPLPLAAFQSRFVRAYEVLDDAQFSKYAEKISKDIPTLLGDSDGTAAEDSINGILNNTPFRVSYRVQNELVLYLSVLIENAGFPEEIDALIGEATLAILLEKVLPRVQGEQKQLETKGGKSNILKDMKAFVETHFAPKPDENGDTKENPLYTKVVKKLEEMDGKLTGYYTNFF